MYIILQLERDPEVDGDFFTSHAWDMLGTI